MALTPSARLKLFKEIPRRLEKESWKLIDLSLEQFGFSTSGWDVDEQGGRDAYILDKIIRGNDDALAGLGKHLGVKFDEPQSTKIERNPEFRLFISHLATHRAFAAELQNALISQHINSFVAHNDIEPSAEWQNEIEDALLNCHALVALLHPNFHVSKWTDQELGFAMGRRVPVFAMGFGEVPYGFIGKFQAINGINKTVTDLARELVGILERHSQTKDRLAAVRRR